MSGLGRAASTHQWASAQIGLWIRTLFSVGSCSVWTGLSLRPCSAQSPGVLLGWLVGAPSLPGKALTFPHQAAVRL